MPILPRPKVYKGSTVLYHDPETGEACAALVCKVHPLVPDALDPDVNLVFWTEEGASARSKGVAWGPGRIGCWWFPGEA